MSLVVGRIDSSAMCNELTGNHVLTIETCDVQTRVAMAANSVHLDAKVQQQPNHIDLTARRRRVEWREHLNTQHMIQEDRILNTGDRLID